MNQYLPSIDIGHSVTMACLRNVVFLALVCAVASAVAVDQDAEHPPQNGDNDLVPLEDVKTIDLAPGHVQDLNDPIILAEIEARKFFRPPIFHPYYYPLLHRPHPSPETPETEEETVDEDTNEDEAEILEDAQPYDPATDLDNNETDQTGEQETDEVVPFEIEASMDRKSYEVPCDYLNVPRYSCYTCYTYLVCKPEGGKIKSCTERDAPHCDNGVCSATPSAECSENSTRLFY